VLEAAAIALGALFKALQSKPMRDFRPDDVRKVVEKIDGIPDLRDQLPVVVDATATLPGESEPVGWTRSLHWSADADTTDAKLPEVVLLRIINSKPPLPAPILAQY